MVSIKKRLEKLEKRVDPPQPVTWELVVVGEGEPEPEADGDDWVITIGGENWKEGSDGELIETA